MFRIQKDKYSTAELALYFLCLVAPWLAAAFVSFGVFERELIPEISAVTDSAQNVPTMLTSLAGSLIGISAGILVAGWYIFRQEIRTKGDLPHIALALANSASGFASIYVGLRVQYEIAIIVATAELDIELISPVFGWQSGLILLQISMLAVAATHFFLNRDKRVRL